MENFQKSALEECKDFIRKELDPFDIYNGLLEMGIFSAAEIEQVEEKEHQNDQVNELVSILQTKDRSSFYCFLEVLNSFEHYKIIAQNISEKEAVEKEKLEDIIKELAKYPGTTTDFKFLEMMVNIAQTMTKAYARKLCDHFEFSGKAHKNIQEMENRGKQVVDRLLQTEKVSVTNASALYDACETLNLKQLQKHIQSYQGTLNYPELVVRLEDLNEEFFNVVSNALQDSVVVYWKSKLLDCLFGEHYGIHFKSLYYDNTNLKLSLRLTSVKSFEQLSEHMQTSDLAEKILRIVLNESDTRQGNQCKEINHDQQHVKVVCDKDMHEHVLQQLKELEKDTQHERTHLPATTKAHDDNGMPENNTATAMSEDPMIIMHKKILYDYVDLFASDLHVDIVLDEFAKNDIIFGQEIIDETLTQKERVFCLVECLAFSADSTFYAFIDILDKSDHSKHLAKILRKADTNRNMLEEQSFYWTVTDNVISPYAKMKNELCKFLTSESISKLSLLLRLNPVENEKTKSGIDLLRIMEEKCYLSEHNVVGMKEFLEQIELLNAMEVVDAYQKCQKSKSNIPPEEKRNEMLPLNRKILNAIRADMATICDVDKAARSMNKSGIFSTNEVERITSRVNLSSKSKEFLDILRGKDDNGYWVFRSHISQTSDLFSVKICYLETKFMRCDIKGTISRGKDFLSNLTNLTSLDLSYDGKDKCLVSPIRVVLIGKTGSGKSSTGNTILGQNTFKIPKKLFSSCTKYIELEAIKKGTTIIEVMDTPGLFDTGMSIGHDSKLLEVAKAILEFRNGIDVFILVCRLDSKFTQEEEKTISDIEKRFGKEIYQHCLLVLTHGRLYKESYKDIVDFVADQSLPNGLKRLLKNVYQNVVIVENDFGRASFEKELMREVLLSSICRFVGNKEGSKYSNKTFEEVQKRIEEENRKQKTLSEVRKHIFSHVYKYILQANEEKLQELKSQSALHVSYVKQLQNDIQTRFDFACDIQTIQLSVRQKAAECADLIDREIKARKQKKEKEIHLREKEENKKKTQEHNERQQKEKNRAQNRVISAMAMYTETATVEQLKSLIDKKDFPEKDTLKLVLKYVSEHVTSNDLLEMAKAYANQNKKLIGQKIKEKENEEKIREEKFIQLATEIIKNKLCHYMASLSESELQNLKKQKNLTKKQLEQYDNEFRDNEFKHSIKAKLVGANVVKNDIDRFIMSRQTERRQLEERSRAEKSVEKCLVSYIQKATEETLKKLTNINAFPEESLKALEKDIGEYEFLRLADVLQIAKSFIAHSHYMIETRLQDIKTAERQLQMLKHEKEVELQSILEKHFGGLTEDKLSLLKDCKKISLADQEEIIKPLNHVAVSELVDVKLKIETFITENIDKYISLKKKETQRRYKADEILHAKRVIGFGLLKFIETTTMDQMTILTDPQNLPLSALKHIITHSGNFKFLTEDDLIELCREVITESDSLIKQYVQNRIEELKNERTKLKLETEATLETKIVAYLENLSTSQELYKIKSANAISEEILLKLSERVVPSQIKTEINVKELAQSVIEEHIDIFISKMQAEEEEKIKRKQLQEFEDISRTVLYTYMEAQSETNLQDLIHWKTNPEEALPLLKNRMNEYKYITIEDIAKIVQKFVEQNQQIIETKIANKKEERQTRRALEFTQHFLTCAEKLTEGDLQGLKSNFKENFPLFLMKTEAQIDQDLLEIQNTIQANIGKHIDVYIKRKQEEKRQAETQARQRELEIAKTNIEKYISKQITDSNEEKLTEFLSDSYPSNDEVANLEIISAVESNPPIDIKSCVRSVVTEKDNEIKEKLKSLKTVREKEKHDALVESTKEEVANIVDGNVRNFLRKLGKEEMKSLQSDIKSKLPDKIFEEIKQEMSPGPKLSDEELKTVISTVITSRTKIIEDIVKNELCFPNGSIVTTKQRGKISISQVEVGDKVLTINEYSQIIFEDIFFLAHSEDIAFCRYVAIQTEKQKSIHISPNHCLPVGNIKSLISADTVKANDIIFYVEEHALIPDKVLSVKYEYLQGAHCPYTLNGTLVVDDIAASCFSSTLSPSLSQGLLAPLRLIYRCTPLPLYKLMFTPKVMLCLARLAKAAANLLQ